MASNFFGQIFRITTFGESHGPCIGVVIDGCPAGLSLSCQDIDEELSKRAPGKNSYTTQRKEADTAEILSGVFEGKTTGVPIAIVIQNKDADSTSYETIKNLYRPGHANFTYLAKYGCFDYRGGGKASGRETAARVAAGAVAKKLLKHFQIECVAFISEIGGIPILTPNLDLATLRQKTHASPIFCPDEIAEKKICQKISEIKEAGDSLGGVISCVASVPIGLGDPVYDKLEAKLACAMLSIPASKGFEIGAGLEAAKMLGSEHNDTFEDRTRTKTNIAGGTLGGISTGSPLFFRTAFKPTSSIKKPQQTVSLQGEKVTFQLPESARHDPCLCIRAVPVVEAMTALVLVDALLMKRNAKL